MLHADVTHNLIPDESHVAPAQKMSEFDCSALIENKLCAIIQTRLCFIKPEYVEISIDKSTHYAKYFRKESNASKCRIQQQRENWQSRHNNHSSIDRTIAGKTSDLDIPPQQCRTLAKGNSINVQEHWISADWDNKTPVVYIFVDPTSSHRKHCETRGWTSWNTFINHVWKNDPKSYYAER